MRADLQRLKRDTESGRAAASSGSVSCCGRRVELARPGGAHLRSVGFGHRFRRSDGARCQRKSPSKARELGARCGLTRTAAIVAGGLYYRSANNPKPLTDKDTIVLADFANSTGDPVFDDTLKTALSVSLNQSPFLNVLSENKVAATLEIDDPSRRHEDHT